jgi:putative cell wall-binding protein
MPSARRAPLALLTALALVLGLAISPAAAPAAQASPTTATLTGRVIMPPGLSVPTWSGGLTASSVRAAGPPTTLASTPVAADGTFTLTGLTPGEHRILFSGGINLNTIAMYHDGSFRFDDVEPLTLQAGANEPLEVQLYTGGSIVGLVSGPNGEYSGSGEIEIISAPPAYYSTSAGRVARYEPYFNRYRLTKLPPGDYVIRFVPSVANLEWWPTYSGNVRGVADAVAVTVGFDEQVTGADLQLLPRPSLSGTYTAVRHPSVPGDQPTYITVRPFPGTTAGVTRSVYVYEGPFRIAGVDPGQYQVCGSRAGTALGPLSVLWCLGQDEENPDGIPVTVGEDGATGVDLSIELLGSITVSEAVYPDPDNPGYFSSPVALWAKYWRWDEQLGVWELEAEGSTFGAASEVTGPRIKRPGSYRIEITYATREGPVYREYWPGDVTRFVDAEIVELLPGEQKWLVGMPLAPGAIVRERISGADRFSTAVRLSGSEFADGSSPVVVIANGRNYPDALAAGPAAAALGGPLLLVSPTAIPAVVQSELARLQPSRIIIAGGTGSVSAAVEAQLRSYVSSPGDVVRLWGADRYATSRAVVDEVFGGLTGVPIFVATGSNYPDALAAGAAASYYGGAVLLVNGSAASIDAATRTLLDRMDPSFIVIAGGPGAVSNGIGNQLIARYQDVDSPVIRLFGAGRYETAAAINALFLEADSVYLANGQGFADALAAGPIAARTGSPLYLALPTCVPSFVLSEIEDLGARNMVVVGGAGVLSDRVLNGTPC